MALRHTIESISANGSRESSSRDVEKSEVLIGRGPTCDILLQSRFVSLVHAKLTLAGDALVLEDQGSLGGVFVNRRGVARATLSPGDEVKLGDVLLRIGRSDGLWEITEVRGQEQGRDLDTSIREDSAALNVAKAFPSPLRLSLILMLICVVVFFVYPFVTPKKLQWSSGTLAAAHQMIAHDCASCHDGNFVAVRDQKCLACHEMSEHAEALHTSAALAQGIEPSCAECHMDHNGEKGIIVSQTKLCTSCHAQMAPVLARSGSIKDEALVARDIVSFSAHPEFRVSLQPDAPGREIRRVSLDDAANLKDNSRIKLNHKVHLEPNLRTKTGKKTLDCQYCHTLSDDFRTMKPMSFEANCSECHGLEFDDRLPGVEVPHGNDKVVYRFLYSEYAKLLLAGEGQSASRQQFVQRGGRLPGRETIIAEEQSAQEFSREFVEQESRNAERVLFTKTACFLCHDVTEKRISEPDAREGGESRFEIHKPQIPARWMPASIFSHGAHEGVLCSECHAGVANSQRTSDVLLPKIETCRDCHAEGGHAGSARADCITCHPYHEPQVLPNSKKREVQAILSRAG